MSIIEAQLEKADLWYLQKSYDYAAAIEKSNSDPLRSRVYALAMSAICAVGAAIKSAKMAFLFGINLLSSIRHLRLETGNFQAGMMSICELTRDVAGVALGSLVGVIAPQKSRDLFLMKPDTYLDRVLTPVRTSKLYAIMYGVSSFLDRNNIRYQLVAGSLLGAIRHGGVIPWDDDGDLGIHPDDKARLHELMQDGTFERETGLSVRWQPFTGGWQVYHPHGEQGAAILGGTLFPFVDLFPMSWQGERSVYDGSIMAGMATEEYITRDEWSNTRDYVFGPITLKGMADPTAYRDRAWGESVNLYAYQTVHHLDFSLKRFPQRCRVVTTTPAPHDELAFVALKQEIDAALNPAEELEEVE